MTDDSISYYRWGLTLIWGKKTAMTDKDQFTFFELIMP